MAAMSLRTRRTVLGVGLPVALVGLGASAVVLLGPSQAMRATWERANARARQQPPGANLPAPTGTEGQPPGETPDEAVRFWWRSGPKDRLDDFGRDLRSFATAPGEPGSSARRDAIDAACQKLSGDVRVAIRLPPSPDTEANTAWAETLTALDNFALHCHQGIQRHSTGASRATQSDAKAATAAAQRLQDRIDELIGPLPD